MKENQAHVNSIVQTMEDILSGHIKRCPKCEELLDMMEYEVEYEPDEGEETIKCLQCGHVDNWQEFDADLYDNVLTRELANIDPDRIEVQKG